VIERDDATTQGREPVSDGLYRVALSWLTINRSLLLESAALHFNFVHTTDFVQHAEITLHGALQGDYTMKFLIEDKEQELHTQDNRTWTAAGRPYDRCFPITCTC